MTEREKIKEMARAICGNSYNPKTGICDKSDIKCDFSCVAYLKSKRMYALGYGNVKEAVKEFAKKLKKRVEEAKTDIVPEGCDMYFENGAICCEVIIFLKMDELIKEVCGD